MKISSVIREIAFLAKFCMPLGTILLKMAILIIIKKMRFAMMLILKTILRCACLFLKMYKEND